MLHLFTFCFTCLNVKYLPFPPKLGQHGSKFQLLHFYSPTKDKFTCNKTACPHHSFFFSQHDCIDTFIVFFYFLFFLPFKAVQPHSWVTLFSLIHSSMPQLWLVLIAPIAIAVQRTKGKRAKTHKSRYEMIMFLLHYIFLPSSLDLHMYHTQ